MEIAALNIGHGVTGAYVSFSPTFGVQYAEIVVDNGGRQDANT